MMIAWFSFGITSAIACKLALSLYEDVKLQRQKGTNMKSQFIQDVEAFAKEMEVRLPNTHEGGIIIMATDSNDIAKCIIARPSHRKELVEHMLTDEKIQSDVLEIMSEYDNE